MKKKPQPLLPLIFFIFHFLFFIFFFIPECFIKLFPACLQLQTGSRERVLVKRKWRHPAGSTLLTHSHRHTPRCLSWFVWSVQYSPGHVVARRATILSTSPIVFKTNMIPADMVWLLICHMGITHVMIWILIKLKKKKGSLRWKNSIRWEAWQHNGRGSDPLSDGIWINGNKEGP